MKSFSKWNRKGTIFNSAELQCTTVHFHMHGCASLLLQKSFKSRLGVHGCACQSALLCITVFQQVKMSRLRIGRTHLYAWLYMPLHLQFMDILIFPLQVLVWFPLALIQTWAYLTNQHQNTKIKLKTTKN